jgi:phosphate:Na+ symporter
MGSLVLLDLMGGVALLLWGLHMVRSGILRAFGPDLRRFLAGALNNRFTAFAAGIGLTALLQSSTATALITSSPAAASTSARDSGRWRSFPSPSISSTWATSSTRI